MFIECRLLSERRAGESDSQKGARTFLDWRFFQPERVDEEEEVIEMFGGNLPVYHHRYNLTKTAGDGRTERVYVVLQFIHIVQ